MRRKQLPMERLYANTNYAARWAIWLGSMARRTSAPTIISPDRVGQAVGASNLLAGRRCQSRVTCGVGSIAWVVDKLLVKSLFGPRKQADTHFFDLDIKQILTFLTKKQAVSLEVSNCYVMVYENQWTPHYSSLHLTCIVGPAARAAYARKYNTSTHNPPSFREHMIHFPSDTCIEFETYNGIDTSTSGSAPRRWSEATVQRRGSRVLRRDQFRGFSPWTLRKPHPTNSMLTLANARRQPRQLLAHLRPRPPPRRDVTRPTDATSSCIATMRQREAIRHEGSSVQFSRSIWRNTE